MPRNVWWEFLNSNMSFPAGVSSWPIVTTDFINGLISTHILIYYSTVNEILLILALIVIF